MADKFVKVFSINEKGISGTKNVSKEELDNLRGNIVILRPEDSEIAKKLGIGEKGVYGARYR